MALPAGSSRRAKAKSWVRGIWRSRRMRTHLIGMYLVIVVIPLLIALAVIRSGVDAQLRQDALERQARDARLLAFEVTEKLSCCQRALGALVAYPGLMDMSRDEQLPILQSLNVAHPDLAGLALHDPQGGVLSHVGNLPVLPAETFRQASAAGQDGIVQVVRMPDSGRPAVAFVRAVREAGGNVIALACTAMESAVIRNCLKGHIAHVSCDICLVDDGGNLIATGQRGSSALDDSPAIGAVLQRGDDSGHLDEPVGARQDLVGYARVAPLAATIILRRPLDDVLAPIRAIRTTGWIYLGAVGVLLVAMGVYAAGRLVRPVKGLVRAAIRLANGGHPEPVPPTGIIELDQLSRSFDRMAGALVDRTRELQRSRSDLEREVARRTAELTQTNARLETELAERNRIKLALHASEERLRLAAAAAEQASRQKDHFVALLSHELRTPLTPVIAAVSAIDGESSLPPRLRDDMELIRRNLEMEARLVDDLLDLTRIRRDKLELHREITDVRLAVEHAVNVCCTEQMARRGQRIVTEWHADRSVANADPSRLQQAFWNLIKNALKFSDDGAAVVVRAENVGVDSLRIEVIDTGVGIDPEMLPRLFTAYEQGGTDVTRQYGGLGLGLTISKGIVEAHGGMLAVHSEGKGRGSTFTVELPLCQPADHWPDGRDADATRPATSGSGDIGVAHAPLRILLVEDHADTARMLARLLEANGHKVHVAGTIESAAQLAGQNAGSIDMVVSDLGLPDGSGLDLMRLLKRQYGLRGIALSGHGMEDDIRRSIEAGFSEHITKPVNSAHLEEALFRAIRQTARR